ncbi:hypothetical protein [Patulibacter americanus]|uniref:hypothetical protein n=1 Tax=Patulibacter americanus TaxID=588672 RepID=UPI0003B5060B|nr:hypothetical protein [Patulibacter americanus]
MRVEDQRRIARRRVLLALSLERRLDGLPVRGGDLRVERGPSSAAPAADEGRRPTAG